MSEAPQTPETRAAATTADTKALVRTIVGTGIGIGTLLLMLVGLMFQQNANVNARIDDVNANVNRRIDDLRGEMNQRLDSLQADIREIRAMVAEALKGSESAD